MQCCYEGCTNSSWKIRKRGETNIRMIYFPKPKTQRARCLEWINCLGRKEFGIENIKRQTVICSSHFVGGSGPSLNFPNPIRFGEVNNLEYSERREETDSSAQFDFGTANIIGQASFTGQSDCIDDAKDTGCLSEACNVVISTDSQNQTGDTHAMLKAERMETDDQFSQNVVCATDTSTSATPIIESSDTSASARPIIESSECISDVAKDSQVTRQFQFDLKSIFYSFVDLSIIGWTSGYSVTSDGIPCLAIMKAEYGTVPNLILSIDCTMKVSITIDKNLLPEYNLLLHVVPPNISSIDQFERLMTTLCNWNPAANALEEDLTSHSQTHSQVQSDHHGDFDEMTNSLNHNNLVKKLTYRTTNLEEKLKSKRRENANLRKKLHRRELSLQKLVWRRREKRVISPRTNTAKNRK